MQQSVVAQCHCYYHGFAATPQLPGLLLAAAPQTRKQHTSRSGGGGGGPAVLSLLSLGDLNTCSNRLQEKLLQGFNDLVRRGCDRVPIGGSGSSLPSLNQEAGDMVENIGHRMEAAGEEEPQPSGQDEKRRKNVLILMSDTGGGHRASAEAIKATFELEYGDEYKVNIIDLWKEYTPWPFNQAPRAYSFFVKHETLWKLAFHTTAPRVVHQSQMAATAPFVAREVAKGLSKYQPDLIVSVHPLMQHIPLRVLRARGLLHKIPFTTVITDLSTCHPTWFHKLVTRCFCPTNTVAQRALKAGLQPYQLRVHGLPIRPSFSNPTHPKDELRKELEMDEELPAVLLMGGGEGMGPVETTARALGEALYDANTGKPIGQLVVVCGRNKNLVRKLQQVNWKIPIQVQGFVTNMSEWMAACDCIITKAGPGTIAEAMIRGLPMLLFDFIAGQEVGNVSFVVENGAGTYCEEPKDIAKIIADWFGSKADELREMAANARKLAQPDAVFKIVHDLDDLVRNKKACLEQQTFVYHGLI